MAAEAAILASSIVLSITSPSTRHWEQYATVQSSFVLSTPSVLRRNEADMEARRRLLGDPSGFSVCCSGGASTPNCVALGGNAALPVIEVALQNGVSELSLWVSENRANASLVHHRPGIHHSWQSASDAMIGLRDLIRSDDDFAADTAGGQAGGHAQTTLKQSAPLLGPFAGSWRRAARQHSLGVAIVEALPTIIEPWERAAAIAEAAGALSAAAVVGIPEAEGALEELFFVSGAQIDDFTAPLPDFPCDTYGAAIPLSFAEVVPPNQALSMATMKFPAYRFESWGTAKAELRRLALQICRDASESDLVEGREDDAELLKVEAAEERCVRRVVARATTLLGEHCGDLRNVSSIVEVRERRKSDIGEHLRTLQELAAQSTSVLECGVRGGESSWAILLGLTEGTASSSTKCEAKQKRDSETRKRRLYQNDIEGCSSAKFQGAQLLHRENVEVSQLWKSDLDIDLDRDLAEEDRGKVDMLFIDTLHVYGQLKRELRHFAGHVNKFIVMHDTVVDGRDGEFVRNYGRDGAGESYDAGKTWLESYMDSLGWEDSSELTRGLWPALLDFLESPAGRCCWRILHHFANNNGLTVLHRINNTTETSGGPDGISGSWFGHLSPFQSFAGSHGSSTWPLRQPCSFEASKLLELRVPVDSNEDGGDPVKGAANETSHRVLNYVTVPLRANNTDVPTFLLQAFWELQSQFREVCSSALSNSGVVPTTSANHVHQCSMSLHEQVVAITKEYCSS